MIGATSPRKPNLETRWALASCVERPKCGRLVALQALVLQRAARDGDVREEEEVTEGQEMERDLG